MFQASSDRLSFLCISADEAADKVTVFAVTTESAQRGGLNANEWVSGVLNSVGGKGGGKPGMAQGSASGCLLQTGNLVSKAKQMVDSKVVA